MRIIKIDKNMTFSEFKEKYGKKFPISKESKRDKAVAAEYKRLTGRDATENAPPVKVARAPRRSRQDGEV